MLQTIYTSCSWLFITGSNQKEGLFEASFPFLIALFAISLWLVWTTRLSRKPTVPLPPGPRGLPIVGYLPFLGSDNLHLAFTDLGKIFGPIYKLWLGNKLCVVVGSPEMAKEVVRGNDVTFSERDPPAVAKIITFDCNDIVFDSYSNPEWRMKRKVLVREMLSTSSIKSCHGLRREQLEKTITNAYKSAGKPIDFGELSFLSSINSVMSMLLGGKQGAGDQKDGANSLRDFRELMSELMVVLGKPNVSDLFPLLSRFDIQGLERAMKKIRGSFDKLFDSMIEARRNVATEVDDKGDEKDFLQFLLELKDKNDSSTSITMKQLKALMMVSFFS